MSTVPPNDVPPNDVPPRDVPPRGLPANDVPPKVSVIIAAYAPGDGIERVFASLDAQTLPQREFEVIVVDDGSPDDTLQRLERMQATRPNLHFTSIENSGWASRPRNVAIGMARGEYLLFMDHDDSLYPDALRRGYEYATENHADVLSAKESKSNNVGWAFSSFLANIPNAVPEPGITALLPMVPHKIYRRAFIEEHGIRFPEGRRVLWEDIYFNVAAYRHAEVVSVLADTPVYQWVITGDNNSSTYGARSEEFWQRLIDLVTFIDETLSPPEHAATRRTMLLQQYRVRVLSRFHPLLSQVDDPKLPMAMGYVNRILDTWIPEDWDADLGRLDRARSALLRQGRPDLLRELHQAERTVIGRSEVDSLAWVDGVLQITSTARWRTEEGEPLTLRQDGDRLVRELPDAVVAALPADMLDLSSEVAAVTSLVTVHDRASKVTWALPTASTVRLEPVGDGTVTPVVTAVSRLDPRTAAFGRPLTAPTWDLHARNTWADSVNHRAIVYSGTPAPAIVDGTPLTVYANMKQALSMDLGQRLRSVVKDSAGFADGDHGTLKSFSAHLLGIAATGAADIPVKAWLAPVDEGATGVLSSRRLRQMPIVGKLVSTIANELDGRLVADATGVHFVGSGHASRGTYRLKLVIAADTASPASTLSSLTVQVSGGGKVHFGTL